MLGPTKCVRATHVTQVHKLSEYPRIPTSNSTFSQIFHPSITNVIIQEPLPTLHHPGFGIPLHSYLRVTHTFCIRRISSTFGIDRQIVSLLYLATRPRSFAILVHSQTYFSHLLSTLSSSLYASNNNTSTTECQDPSSQSTVDSYTFAIHDCSESLRRRNLARRGNGNNRPLECA
jgi:hypothetical protein